LLVEDLHALGYTRFREVSFHPTEGLRVLRDAWDAAAPGRECRVTSCCEPWSGSWRRRKRVSG
jgi:hypothetical protein